MKNKNRWSHEEEFLLKKAFENCKSADEIHKQYFSDRTLNLVKVKMYLLELVFDKQWTEEEENILKNYYTELPVQTIQSQLLPHKTINAIQSKAKRLELRQRNRWTKIEETYLKENYLTQSYKDIGKKLGRNEAVVRAKAHRCS